MGPLVPDIISNEFNFIIAFLVGVLFGLALEQAGFSSTKKLVGLFYGYDFTVLKVFFTAGVTAMVGVLILSHLGLLDLRMIYINPTFLRSALVGGVIMGGGFILGGFCPGTSVCAAAVGKIDAWAFIGGSLIGIFVFVEVFPWIQDFYMADNMGFLTMYDQLGISPEFFAIGLTAVALLAFYVTAKIEDRVNGIKVHHPRQRVRRYALVAITPLILIAFTAFTPDIQTARYQWAEYTLNNKNVDFHTVHIDQLTEKLVSSSSEINVIDVRSSHQFKEFSIPTSINVPLDSLLRKEYNHLLEQPYKMNVFVGGSVEETKMAYLLANSFGRANNRVLLTSPRQFRMLYYDMPTPAPEAGKAEKDIHRFRRDVGKRLRDLEQRLKELQQPVKKKVKRVTGGCA